MERWLPVPGHEGKYDVSDEGRVRSLVRLNGFKPGGLRRTPLILKPRPNPSGHMKVAFGRASEALIHRIVLLAFVGPPPDGAEGSHLNGDPTDNRLNNLTWETRRENFARKVAHGTAARGEKNPLAVLSQAEVGELRRLVASGESQASVARTYGVSQSTISRIVNRKRWKYS